MVQLGSSSFHNTKLYTVSKTTPVNIKHRDYHNYQPFFICGPCKHNHQWVEKVSSQPFFSNGYSDILVISYLPDVHIMRISAAFTTHWYTEFYYVYIRQDNVCRLLFAAVKSIFFITLRPINHKEGFCRAKRLTCIET